MGLSFETRGSDSPWIDIVWTCRSEQVTEMTSVASETVGLVFWEQRGVRYASVTGPENRCGTAPVPEGAHFVGIQFAVGTALRMVATPQLLNGGVLLPDVGNRTFALDGDHRETPQADDAEALVTRLVRDGVLVRDPLVADLLRGHRPAAAERTLERRFRAATGLTQGAVRQIGRARTAAVLLAGGETASAVVDKLEYYDEPHLARALRKYIGRTAQQLRSGGGGNIALDPGQRTTTYTSLLTPLE